MTPSVLGTCPGFTAVTEPECQQLLRFGSERWHVQGTILMSPTHALDGSCLVLSGTVQPYLHVSDRLVAQPPLHSGEWLGAAAASLVCHEEVTALAASDVRLFHLPAASLEQLQRAEPSLANRVLRGLAHSLSQQLVRLVERQQVVADIAHRTARRPKPADLQALGVITQAELQTQRSTSDSMEALLRGRASGSAPRSSR